MLASKDPKGKNRRLFQSEYDKLVVNGEPSSGFQLSGNIVPSFENLEISKNKELRTEYDVP
tara:strand:+ start:334 stop:516 length:183 start_codon:yes stop_codon:yes gene_type:complete